MRGSWPSLAASHAARAGLGLVAIVLALVVVLAIGTLATSFQVGTTTRSHARIVLARTFLVAAECAFAEAAATLERAGEGDATAAGLDWRAALLPPYTPPLPRGKVVPARTRALYRQSHDLDISDVEVVAVNRVDQSATGHLVRGHGVLELSVAVRGARGWIEGGRTARRRVQFYCRYKPVIEWPPGVPSAPGPVPIQPRIADVVILTAPLAMVVEG